MDSIQCSDVQGYLRVRVLGWPAVLYWGQHSWGGEGVVVGGLCIGWWVHGVGSQLLASIVFIGRGSSRLCDWLVLLSLHVILMEHLLLFLPLFFLFFLLLFHPFFMLMLHLDSLLL